MGSFCGFARSSPFPIWPLGCFDCILIVFQQSFNQQAAASGQNWEVSIIHGDILGVLLQTLTPDRIPKAYQGAWVLGILFNEKCSDRGKFPDAPGRSHLPRVNSWPKWQSIGGTLANSTQLDVYGEGNHLLHDKASHRSNHRQKRSVSPEIEWIHADGTGRACRNPPAVCSGY